MRKTEGNEGGGERGQEEEFYERGGMTSRRGIVPVIGWREEVSPPSSLVPITVVES